MATDSTIKMYSVGEPGRWLNDKSLCYVNMFDSPEIMEDQTL